MEHPGYALLAAAAALFFAGFWLARGMMGRIRAGEIDSGSSSRFVHSRKVSRWEEPRLFWQFVVAGFFFAALFIGGAIVFVVMFLHRGAT